MFPKIGVPQNGWFIIMENPIKIHDLGVPLFLETPIYFIAKVEISTTFINFVEGPISNKTYGLFECLFP